MTDDYLNQLFRLDGKTAVITGGAGTIGSAIGESYAHAGANVLLWDVRQDALEKSVQALRKSCQPSAEIDGIVVDMMNEQAIETALSDSITRFGQVNILVNACGGHKGKSPIIEQDMDDYEHVLKLNLLAGCFVPTKIFGRYWIEQGIKGRIINIASMTGFTPLSGVSGYAAAKAAVINQTKAAAQDFGPYGINVNAIAPGFFLTDQSRPLLLDTTTGNPNQRGQEILGRTPFGRFGEPEELCGIALLLAGEQAGSFISGAIIPVDGAFLCDNI